MTTPTPPGVVQRPWPGAFGADFQRRILSAIVEGAPFSLSCTPLPTQRTAVAFGVLDTADPAWGGELDEVPDLAKDQTTYEVGVSRLSGSILISQESIDDADFPLTQQVTQVLQDTFSNKLDKDLLGAAGPAPVPTGILSVAAEVTAADWHLAAVAAKASMATAGGAASHITLSPAVLGQIESARDELGRQLYPDAATTFAGLVTVPAVGATAPVVYDRSRCWLVVRRDFTADFSRETDAAWRHYATSLRLVGRFALAVPQPSKACRKLAVSDDGRARAAKAGKAA
jgi:HK97 family phage major capsid protein